MINNWRCALAPRTKSDEASILQARIGAAVAAKLIDVTPRRLQQFADDGVIPKQGRGEYVVTDVVKGYIAFLRGERKDSARAQHQNRVADARTREIELRIAEKTRELVNFEEVDGYVQELVGAFVAVLAGLPAEITRDINARAKIETIVDGHRKRLADLCAKRREAVVLGRDDVEATNEDDA